MRSLLLLIIAGALSFSANASNWVLVSGTSEYDEYVDIDSISRDGDYRTAFYKDTYFEDRKTSFSEPHNVRIVFSKYDCGSNPKKSMLLSYVNIKNDKVVATGDLESITKLVIIYPDTVGEATANFVCSY